MSNIRNIHFAKVTVDHLDTIFSWLTEPHIMEFWDHSREHKDDILNFVQGRKTPSAYAGGEYVYWTAFLEHEPFGMLMTIRETYASPINEEKLDRLSKTGHTYRLDYMIGSLKFFGKRYGAKTLSEFIDFFQKEVDLKADTFLIDPEQNNPRAKHIYMKAGFDHMCDFIMEGDVSGGGKIHHLLVKKFEPKISIIKATMDDYYPCIQNMARFYVYDLSRECGSISSDWAIPENGLYESFDFKNYFIDLSRKVYLVKVYDEIAGFVLLNQATEDSTNTWNMGEFFIIAKFQGSGIATRVAKEIWNMHPGKWEVSVIPNNKSALKFWEKAISEFTSGTFNKRIKEVTYDEHYPRRIIFEFDTQNSILKNGMRCT
jgi:predicted acetyltransferase/RimJ/RimL family protein N-acetyltransferase